MIHLKSFAGKLIFGFVLAIVLQLGNSALAQDGKALFSQNCASCHAVNKQLTGPALAGVEDRWPDKAILHHWIRNNQEVIKSGYPYAVNLYNQFNKTQMNLFPAITDKEIDAILAYIKTAAAEANATPAGGTPADAKNAEGDNTLLFGILTLVLAIIAFVLLQVNSNLKKLSDDKDGIPSHEPVPFWRNKSYIALLAVVLFLIGGILITKGAIGLGRSQNYEPEQPIFYSHKVHAGVNQINCLYCHTGAQYGKQATIPSVNICMNCHMAINEYKGPKIYNGEGEEVNGTAEIQKLYKYAGFEPGKPWDASKAKPIEWTRIHNLPDHVYFNHSQHVVAGKQQCQTCHGDIPKMDEVKQFAPLSMGWCINCHRTTQVQFKENDFYSIYTKFHDQLKRDSAEAKANGRQLSKEKSGITVEQIGGTECQKCHY
ncbi:c-type cytochrome [Deminuibacter soli]|uniref:Cytochrome C n=1 Tax=Deminuibacter soli TaxID=2291815 RepID=A0A3E1NR44_9BACT|nr:c-type cytochrome [Deminuibacter soli]RFM30370.1 cytochrome C [Deminuibacter soli]